MSLSKLGYTKRLEKVVTLEAAEALVREALKSEGFGIITEIDVKKTMKEKLGIEYKPFKILGACNPSFANRALTIDPYIGLLLPCNVIIFQGNDGGVHISFAKPEEMFKLVRDDRFAELLQEVETAIKRAFEAVEK
ncbi:MAG: DUF302 domain-containing protein [Myxococcota bacterium]